MGYGAWKKKYQKKSTEEQLKKYEESKHLHARHPSDIRSGSSKPTRAPVQMSDVCCENPLSGSSNACAADVVDRLTRLQKPVSSPPVQIRLGVLTVSDRASNGIYEDLSGPE